MEQSAIRDRPIQLPYRPDCAALHPGYIRHCERSEAIQLSRRDLESWFASSLRS
jgi:hypothetical protein